MPPIEKECSHNRLQYDILKPVLWRCTCSDSAVIKWEYGDNMILGWKSWISDVTLWLFVDYFGSAGVLSSSLIFLELSCLSDPSSKNVQITGWKSGIFDVTLYRDCFGSANNFRFPSFSLIFFKLWCLYSSSCMWKYADKRMKGPGSLMSHYFRTAEVLVRSQDIPEVIWAADVMSVTLFCREIF